VKKEKDEAEQPYSSKLNFDNVSLNNATFMGGSPSTPTRNDEMSQSLRIQFEKEVRELTEENMKMKKEVEQLQDYQQELQSQMDKVNKWNSELLKTQQEEREIMRSRSNSITDLAIQLEEKSIVGNNLSRQEFETTTTSKKKLPPTKNWKSYFKIILCCG